MSNIHIITVPERKERDDQKKNHMLRNTSQEFSKTVKEYQPTVARSPTNPKQDNYKENHTVHYSRIPENQRILKNS